MLGYIFNCARERLWGFKRGTSIRLFTIVCWTNTTKAFVKHLRVLWGRLKQQKSFRQTIMLRKNIYFPQWENDVLLYVPQKFSSLKKLWIHILGASRVNYRKMGYCVTNNKTLAYIDKCIILKSKEWAAWEEGNVEPTCSRHCDGTASQLSGCLFPHLPGGGGLIDIQPCKVGAIISRGGRVVIFFSRRHFRKISACEGQPTNPERVYPQLPPSAQPSFFRAPTSGVRLAPTHQTTHSPMGIYSTWGSDLFRSFL